MTDADLDTAYTALSYALGRVGEERAPMLLAMVSLQLMARLGSAADALPLIANAEAQCRAGGVDAASGPQAMPAR